MRSGQIGEQCKQSRKSVVPQLHQVGGQLLFFLLLLLLIAPAAMDTPFEAVAKGNSEFSREFYRVVAEAEPGNLVSSPMSCLIALAMAHAGAKGDSIPKIARGLRLPENITDALKGLSEVVQQLREAQKVELSIANKIYVKQDFPILEEYSTALEKYFQVEAENVVFTDPSTADKINDWVSKQTKDKIQNLVDSNSFDGMTRLVLVNAIYFKGPWLKPFKKDKTHNRPFFTDENNSVEVPFMYQKTHFPYRKLDELDAQLLVMPYEGLELSMAIILPNKKEGLKELEEKLATADLGELLQSGYPRDVEVYLPKFKIETSLNLVDHLSKMGLSHIFSDDVNLTGISTADELKVSKVVQKAFIEVSEEGTEAAAATAAVIRMKRSAFEIDRIVFDADHPFIFNLVIKTNILFSGRVLNFPNMAIVKDEL
ncbi:antichymotrypsin-2-like isoform X1 [Cloeon dipterum]|uniref:antichymotrypsin-2-like isoform X1 n=2 Tax=Cloeon dipterum TaxID=197152 RepID=UPI0032202637